MAPRKAATTKKAPPKAAKTTNTTTANKRKRNDEAPAPPVKRVKQAPVLNEPPSDRLTVYVCGEGSSGELGLGTAKGAIDVKRPRLNPHLAANKVGVVQVSAGGMHCLALTHDNKILTWGVNDQGALGRDTNWEGGLKDMDAPEDSDSDDDEDDNGLNPKESIPGEVDWSQTTLAPNTRFTEVAAGDSCSFALTDTGLVYGWGTFRNNEGVIGFTKPGEIAYRPVPIPNLKKIQHIAAGANHGLALDHNGAVFSWGAGQQNQLGRRIIERTKVAGLTPREFGLPKGKKGMVFISAGNDHSFAISKTGEVWSWGLNNFGETGIPDNAGEEKAVVMNPRIVKSLSGKDVISITGGAHHSLAATQNGDCLVWGRIDGAQMGIDKSEFEKLPADAVMRDEHDKPRIATLPMRVTAIKGQVTQVAASSEHSIIVTKQGKAWAWGYSPNYQTGLGVTDETEVATMIDNTAIRDKQINFAATGGQFSILTSVSEDALMVNGI